MRKRYTMLSSLGFLVVAILVSTAHNQAGITIANAQSAATAATSAATQASEGGSIPQYGLFETTLPITTFVSNTSDPSQINVTVQFTAPDGALVNVPAFWMQPYQQTCTQDCAVELLQPGGNAGWRVRFSPDKVGAWSYTVQQQDTTGSRAVTSGVFTVTPSKRPGFIRVGKNRRFFGYDDGTPYFPIGLNLGWSWSGANGTLGYQKWLKQLHESGANYARLYIDVPWFIGLDWRAPVGNYLNSQEDAWRLDTILETAEEQGIALEIVLVWSQGLTSYGGPPVNIPTTPGRPDMSADWSKNPYNTALGGPLSGPAQFFSTDQGLELFKRRLRYVIARWGYSTNIFAWDMIDQLDRVSVTNPDQAADWLRDSVNYLRTNDPYKHLISAGLKDSSKSALLDRAVLDFQQVRFYQRRPIEVATDQVSGTLNALGPYLGNADRPVMLSEFSLNPWFEPTQDDPTGIHVRETMWATALSGAAGGGASWWWDTYVFPQNLTTIFGPLAAFSRGVPWNSSTLLPVSISLVGDSSVAYAPITLSGYNGTYGGPKAPDVIFRVMSDGVVPPVSTTSSYLYGVTYSTQLSQPQKYIITPPVDTTLTVNVRRVSDKAQAKLAIIVDGKTAGQLTLSPKSQPTSLSVPISAGEHSVVLDNTGPDFLQIDSVEIADYVAPLRSLALADRTEGIFLAWLQNRDYTWENAAIPDSKGPKPVTVSIRVDAMPPGQYRVELWDPFTGNVVGNETVTVPGTKDGPLAIDLLPITQMIAVRAFRVAAPGNAPSATPSLTPTPKVFTTAQATSAAQAP
jgi:Domain of unknown function (DUF5060)